MAAEDWTDEKVKTLTRMWAEGLSASVIGAKIGMSRNAVIGKRIRIGLPGRGGNGGGWRRSREDLAAHIQELRTFETKMKAALPKYQPKTQADGDAPVPLMISLLDLTDQMCRWPVNSPERGGEFLFCAHEKDRGSPYCSFHERIAWTGRPVSRATRPMRRAA